MTALLCGGRARLRLGLRWALLVSWMLIGLGVFGEWVFHQSASLSLSGPDLGEFVKFISAVQDGSVPIHRLGFYLPAAVAALGVALLSGSRELHFPKWTRSLAFLLAAVATLQLLPPAWSPATLRTDEFRLQALALLVCWLLLACSRLLGRMPLALTGSLAGLLALAGAALSLHQMQLLMPQMATLYGARPSLGWGFWTAGLGLAVAFLASGTTALCSARGTLCP